MSSAHPHHQLARHPLACAAQGFSSGGPTQSKQTGMAAGIHRPAPKGAVRQLSARQDQAKVIRLQCLARAEERPALTLVWTCQRMIPWLPCFWCLEAGTAPSLGYTNPQCVLVSFRNLQPQNCSNFSLCSVNPAPCHAWSSPEPSPAWPCRLPAIWHKQGQGELNKC